MELRADIDPRSTACSSSVVARKFLREKQCQ
jgi:hypothetical protein